MNCEEATWLLIGGVIGLIGGNIVLGFVQAWWKDRT
jgi:hypothetical protein